MDHARVMHSEYMPWAKLHSHSRYNLAVSGMKDYPLADLPLELAEIQINAPGSYGYPPLLKALAQKFGLEPAQIAMANGTSMANHLAMAATFAAGEEVLIEHPVYELLLATARYLGAQVKRFERRHEDGFRLDPAAIDRALTPRTKLIVITNLHNPSSVLTDHETLRQIGALARRVGAKVLVDEIYLEAMFERAPASAVHLGSEFVVTSSLTKAYGLSGLRCGWILAEPALIEKIWRLNDLFGVNMPHAAERLSVLALAHLPAIAARAQQLLAANRPILHRFLDVRHDLQTLKPEFGTTVFPRLKSGRVDELCTRLREQHETTIVPGRFFEMPEHFRLGFTGETETLKTGLERLHHALDEL